MFYMPQYHNLPDGRQVFLRFPDPQRHADPVSRLLPEVPQGAETAAYLTEANAHPLRLVLVAEIAGTPAGCGLLELDGTPRARTAVEEAFRSPELEQLLRDALAAVAAQKGAVL